MAFKGVGEVSRFAWALLLILVARRLGGEAFGRISFACSFTSVFVLVADLGLGVLLIREVARTRAQAALPTRESDVEACRYPLSLAGRATAHALVLRLLDRDMSALETGRPEEGL